LICQEKHLHTTNTLLKKISDHSTHEECDSE